MTDDQVERSEPMTCDKCGNRAERVVPRIGFTDGQGVGKHTDLCASCCAALQVWLGNPSGGHFVEFKYSIGDPVVICVGRTGRQKGAVRSCLHSEGPPQYFVRHLSGSGLVEGWCAESELVPDA